MPLTYPVLYSFRRCPYAIRARMCLLYANINLEIREITLRDKPQSMLALSPKGTVPILVLPDSRVIDESLEIMMWALQQHDHEQWQPADDKFLKRHQYWCNWNDGDFKYYLDRYKYADRFPDHPEIFYRQQAELFLKALEQQLNSTTYILYDRLTLTDIAIFPFIRQFSKIDAVWFASAPYPKLKIWLEKTLNTGLFKTAMTKFKPWQPEHEAVMLLSQS
ncbi:MAG: glutathione S-transferase [Methylococcaceae bacterium]